MESLLDLDRLAILHKDALARMQELSPVIQGLKRIIQETDLGKAPIEAVKNLGSKYRTLCKEYDEAESMWIHTRGGG